MPGLKAASVLALTSVKVTPGESSISFSPVPPFLSTSNNAARKMMKEMYRVLKPGGLTLHYDIPYGGEYGLHAQFMLNWDSYYNAEPFWRQWTAIDRTEFLTTAGFDPATIIDAWADRDHEGRFKLFPKPFDEIHTNPKGGIGRPQFFGAWKR